MRAKQSAPGFARYTLRGEVYEFARRHGSGGWSQWYLLGGPALHMVFADELAELGQLAVKLAEVCKELDDHA